MNRGHLVLFVRAPRWGVGKRRLARDIGDAAALRFEQMMLALLLRRLGRDRRWRLRLAVTPGRACHCAGLWPRGVPIAAQGRGDLGERMRRALAACPPGPALLIGSDIPGASAQHIADAFRLLGRHDLVFGPAGDGGFWLIGARRYPRLPRPFCRTAAGGRRTGGIARGRGFIHPMFQTTQAKIQVIQPPRLLGMRLIHATLQGIETPAQRGHGLTVRGTIRRGLRLLPRGHGLHPTGEGIKSGAQVSTRAVVDVGRDRQGGGEDHHQKPPRPSQWRTLHGYAPRPARQRARSRAG